MKKLLLGTLIAAAIIGGGYYFLFSRSDKSGNTVAANAFGWKFPVAKFPMTGKGDYAYSDIREPGGTPQGLPVRLKIPIIGVDSAIEDALITPDGRMDVPFGSINVAWFSLGPHAGRIGSAVIGGHFGISKGVKFVFHDLDMLKIGDQIYIVDDKNNLLTFVIRRTSLFARDADATTVFTSDDGLAHLNLITCEGIWNQVNGNYPERRVVFADLVSSVGSAATVSPIATAFTRSLSIGARGQDVILLQSTLERKGLLSIPTGVVRGYFGLLTGAAVGKYQTSVGLPPVGQMGPLTRAKLNTEIEYNLAFPSTGDEKVSAIVEVSSFAMAQQFIVQLMRGLFETPGDMILTLSLFLGIGFMVYLIKFRK